MYVISKKLHISFVLVAFLCFGLSSCDVINAIDDVVIQDQNKSAYIITKGGHSSNNGFKKLSTNLMRFEVQFDSTAIYQTVNPANQADINKLYGLSDCNSDHHTNSARFGWRWYNNRLEIHAYTYVNKQRASEYITSVEMGKQNVFELRLEDNQYVFLLNDVRVVMPRGCTGSGEGYLLYPYFGGDEVAPHDITIRIRDL